jgi:hypothetical protein
MGMSGVRNLKARAALLVVGLLATLLLLALSACGGAGGQEEAKARPLPLYEDPLPSGEYHSVKFKPSLSFKVSQAGSNTENQLSDFPTWANTENQLSDWIELGYEAETGAISFANVEEVFKPGTTNVVEAPKDLVGWLQHHPYLNSSKPQPVTLGGVKGEQLAVVVDHLPKDYYGNCGMDCLDIFNQSGGEQIGYFNAIKRERRVFVFEDVKGETVVIWFASEADKFDKFAPEAQKVVDSVRWGGS